MNGWVYIKNSFWGYLSAIKNKLTEVNARSDKEIFKKFSKRQIFCLLSNFKYANTSDKNLT